MAQYVIQVTGGKEQHVCDLVSRQLNDLINDCYVPRREVMRRVEGEWVTIRETLFPGYLFVETKKIQHVMGRLARIPAFTRLLGVGDEKVISLSPDEVAWLKDDKGWPGDCQENSLTTLLDKKCLTAENGYWNRLYRDTSSRHSGKNGVPSREEGA